jgi:iron complex outermembrane receptor protein
MNKRILLSSCALLILPTAAFGQSTGTVESEIIVTGTKVRDVAGVQTPETPKAKVVLTQEIIERQNPGQTILDTVNLVPGVSFQNNDAYGSAGGTLTIRGFSSDRVSLTFDGIQLNDSGNYAIYSNQQLDPELIEQVNVNLGSTDVDSPTASATGGTVNIRSLTPTDKMGVRMVGSIGDFDFRRVFGMFNTGEIGPWGTRAWIAASTAKNDVPFNNYGKIDKQQYNAKIWQPLGTNGDFVALSGHYNENRNNFFGSVALRNDRDVPAGFPQTRKERFYDINYPCTLAAANPGVADSPNTCGTEFDRRYNPSNTGNIRGQSRITLAEGIVLTVDPSYQYVKANGGGTVGAFEGFRTVGGVPVTGYISGSPYFGRDLNGDGDILDRVTMLAPSQTHTDRYGVIAGLRWEINPEQMVRVGYTLDHARHRQTGEVGIVEQNGEPLDVFPINDPQEDVDGNVLEKRDRLSYAVLNQLAAEYRGRFGALVVDIGLRAPFFERKLNNYCFTTSSTGFVDCFGSNTAAEAIYAAANPTVQGPQKRNFKYNKLLPNIGFTYDFTSALSGFANYAKGLSVPSTDNLYNSFFFAPDTEQAKPKPETTDSFDGGFRYTTGTVQAQLAGWFTKFNNRQAQAYDPELDRSVFRNLGRVDKWGLDASVAYQPIKQLQFYAFASWMKSKIKDNIQIGAFPAGITSCDDPAVTIAMCAFTKGKYESGSPKYSYGLSAVGTLGPVDLGITAKRTGPRYVFDTNVPVFSGPVAGPTTIIYPAKAPAYWLVNLDARFHMGILSESLSKTYFQLNVYNVFDKVYVGGFGGGLNQAFSGANYGNPPFVQIGAPRTFMGSINIEF